MSRKRLWPKLVLGVIAASLAWAPLARGNETVLVCDVYGNHVVPLPSGVLGIGAGSVCPGDALSKPPGGMSIYTVSGRTVRQGADVAY